MFFPSFRAYHHVTSDTSSLVITQAQIKAMGAYLVCVCILITMNCFDVFLIGESTSEASFG